MPSQSHHLTFQEDHLSDLEDLPLELFEEIASYLDLPTLKALFLTSSIRRAASIRLLFGTLALHGDHEGRSSSSKFLGDFMNQIPVACFRTTTLECLEQDLSEALIPWFTRVHSIKIKQRLVGNTALPPSLIFFDDLELSNLTFWSVADYFRLLASLPSTLKKLTACANTFGDSQSLFHTSGRKIMLEHLETKSADDCAVLLRSDCPITLKYLRVAYPRQARPHDIEDLIQRTPHLVDLRIDIKRPEHHLGTCEIAQNRHTRAYPPPLPVSLPLSRLKSLSITDHTKGAPTMIQLLATPMDIPSPLEVLSFTCLLSIILRNLVISLSTPKFRTLKQLNLQFTAPEHYPYRLRLSLLDHQVGQFQRRLKALGKEICLTSRLVDTDPMDDLDI
ncbi:hypothetical protein F5146DRAFT_1202320 [Armillaria mellea]|nr:hypothetical protein F5146DRAFT_1202320 [Armillaria mellea]